MTRAIRKHLSDFIAIAVLMAIALGVGGYIISQQEARGTFPIVEKSPFKLKADFSDAQAVIPGQGQTVRVAGVEVGKIAGVQPKNGVAEVTLNLDRDKVDNGKLKVLSDATALLRPRTGLKDMFIELDPGTSGRPLHENETIPVQNTAPDVDPDEFLSSLDADTRAYVQLLIGGLGKGFRGHGHDLNAIFKALGPTQRDLARVSRAFADRRHQLARLVHNFGDLTNTLADRDQDVKRLVSASNAVLGAFAQENRNISSAVSKLPGTLTQARSTLLKVDTLGQVMRPALTALRPAFRKIDTANKQVRPFAKEAAPLLRSHIRPFVRYARPYIQDLRPAARDLRIATPDLTQSLYEISRFFNMAGYNPKGREALPSDNNLARQRDEGFLFWLGWVGHLTDSIFSTSDAQGPFRRTLLGTTCDVLVIQANTPLGQEGPLGPGGVGANTVSGVLALVGPTGICHAASHPSSPDEARPAIDPKNNTYKHPTQKDYERAAEIATGKAQPK